MNKIKKLLEIIKRYLIQLFNKQEIKLIEENTIIQNDNNSVENEKEKKDFFIIYENIKKGVIKPEELMINDLIKVQLMMKNELNCINEKIHMSEDEIAEMNYEVINLKKDNKIYATRLQKNNQ